MLTEQTLAAAERSIVSTLRKSEKVYATLVAKQAQMWQIKMVDANIENFRTMLTAIGNALHPDAACEIEQGKREAALRAMPEYIAQIEKILPRFRPGTPQHTLAIRRIAAYQTAAVLLEANNAATKPTSF